jgi:Na+-driven multidrug efflux pump
LHVSVSFGVLLRVFIDYSLIYGCHACFFGHKKAAAARVLTELLR